MMAKPEVYPTYPEALLGHIPPFEKRESPHDVRERGTVVYEDDDFFAIEQTENDHDGDETAFASKVVIVAKNRIESLLDLDVGRGEITLKLLAAIQHVALKLGLTHHGFEIRIDVMPPYQKRDLLEVKLRSGKPPGTPAMTVAES